MKYIITQQFSFNSTKFEIRGNEKLLMTANAKPSDQSIGQFNIKVSIMRPDILGNYPCVVEPDEKRSGNYLIYLVSDKKVLFGQFFYKYATMNDYIYTIVIGNKLYQIKSSDLRNSRLVFMDKCQCDNSSNKNSSKITSPSTTLFQVTDSFSRLNDTYHVNIYDKEWPLGYFAITILFHLHEAQINRYEN